MQNKTYAIASYRMPESTVGIETAPCQPIPAISRVEPRNLTVSVLTFKPLKRERKKENYRFFAT